MSKKVNAYTDYRFQARFRTPDSEGVLDVPAAAGQITGITLRLAATATGAALHGDVDALVATEVSTVPGRFYRVVDTATLVARVLTPLGAGVAFYAIWSKAGDLDMHYTKFTITDRSATS